MKFFSVKILTLSAVSVLLFSSFSFSQGTVEVARAQDAVNKILTESGEAFKQGVTAYMGDQRAVAGERFNRSIEVFLFSTVNIQRESRLQNCYNQLIETVYRIEFPSENYLPQVRSLGLTCGWEIDTLVAENVSRLARIAASKPNVAALPGSSVAATTTVAGEPRIGFVSQEFEPSPLDELSRLELTTEEQQVENNPVAQQQFQYIQVAVNNRSLGFSFQVHPMIQQYINYYRGRGRTTMEVGLYRSGMFMLMARRIFREEGVPENVAWLGQIESAWKPTAMSWASASGLWQFIPGTGARYGLRRTAYVDERNSFDEATRASARYLKFLYNRYGNWELAIAGYNCGEGNVDRAISRAGVSNFWAAYPYLPRETRNYVPNILATVLIANNPQQFGFGHISPAAPLQYDRVRVPASTNLSLLAQAADTSVQYLRYLNPHLRNNVTPPEPYVVNVPARKGDEVVALFRRVPATQINNSNLANTSAGETWQNISNRTGVTVADLMAANPGMGVPKGKVFVPVKGNGVVATSYSRPTNAPKALAPPPKNSRVVKARSGDTVARLAEREKVDPTEVAKLNGLFTTSTLGAGREIKVPLK